ncbi:LolA family protein [Paludisphaera mucosa]|uniref:DUF4179 domain-containing protein n=1 Tax=Paludisphaera mucosa TaxID=3030827 RepID=A0ABT6FAW1_9BACT|nr:hypothetical protein [Paludisphaera mucosa]MDG3004631.1 hypothetical protein [Paludisphaera mucosa]
MTNDDLEGRLARLRAEWPVDSMVDAVTARIEAEPPRRRPRRARRLAGMAASGLGLLGVLTLAWLMIASRPTTLLAAVQRGLEKANAAHLIFNGTDEKGVEHRGDAWYVKGRGVRMEEPGRVIVEDLTNQWSWRTDAGEPVVIRQRTPGFFATQLPQMMALQASPDGWKRERSPELDRDVDGRACRGYTFNAPPELFPGRPAPRAVLLADAEELVRELAVEERREDGTWRRAREVRIEYDPPIPPGKLAFGPPDGGRVIDRDEAFHGRFPLDRALHRVELGGLILAVHVVQPLVDREGFYVVSSVRGTAEFLRRHPPRRRPLNPERVDLDVAFQRIGNGMYGTSYDMVGLGDATRDGVEYGWWLIVPRRFFRLKDGRREYVRDGELGPAAGEPARLDDLPGKARIPLRATYWDPAFRDQRGALGEVSTWAEVPIPPDRDATTIEAVAARARRDLIDMGGGAAGYTLLGIAADAKPDASNGRPMSHFLPESITDADFAAAVRRGLDDLRGWDQIGDVEMSQPPPP